MMKIKRAVSIILTLMTILSTFAIFGSFSASAETGYDRGYTKGMAGTGKVVTKGLDISEHQDGMDVKKIKDAGFDYVILRAGVKLNAGSNRKDYNFEDFYKQARAAGLDIGAYYYSQAKNESEAKEEARCFLEYIKGKTFEYPVYLDFEDSKVRDAIGKNGTTGRKICMAFMDTMAEAGYLVGVYGPASWFVDDQYYSGWMASELNNTIGKKYEFWVANYQYNDERDVPDNKYSKNYPNDYGMYQYSSKHKINGWSGVLDHNVCYKDYPAIVKQYGFNGYEAGSTGTNTTPIETEKATEAETVKANKYAITDDIKKVKEHIGSGISKYTLDGEKIAEVDTFELTAGQKLGIEGFAGFTSYIKEFGYYFDGNADSAVWGVVPGEPTADVKKKADAKAKLFDIDADTTALTSGAHTVTYTAKFLNGKTCDLVTLNINVSGGADSETTAAGDGGCGSSVGVGASIIALATISGAGIVIKRKRED